MFKYKCECDEQKPCSLFFENYSDWEDARDTLGFHRRVNTAILHPDCPNMENYKITKVYPHAILVEYRD